MAVDVQLEDDIGKIEGLVGGYLRSPQDEATRQALSAELDKLDDQTAHADAYSNSQVGLGEVPGTEVRDRGDLDTSTAEDCPECQFKARRLLAGGPSLVPSSRQRQSAVSGCRVQGRRVPIAQT